MKVENQMIIGDERHVQTIRCTLCPWEIEGQLKRSLNYGEWELEQGAKEAAYFHSQMMHGTKTERKLAELADVLRAIETTQVKTGWEGNLVRALERIASELEKR